MFEELEELKKQKEVIKNIIQLRREKYNEQIEEIKKEYSQKISKQTGRLLLSDSYIKELNEKFEQRISKEFGEQIEEIDEKIKTQVSVIAGNLRSRISSIDSDMDKKENLVKEKVEEFKKAKDQIERETVRQYFSKEGLSEQRIDITDIENLKVEISDLLEEILKLRLEKEDLEETLREIAPREIENDIREDGKSIEDELEKNEIDNSSLEEKIEVEEDLEQEEIIVEDELGEEKSTEDELEKNDIDSSSEEEIEAEGDLKEEIIVEEDLEQEENIEDAHKTGNVGNGIIASEILEIDKDGKIGQNEDDKQNNEKSIGIKEPKGTKETKETDPKTQFEKVIIHINKQGCLVKKESEADFTAKQRRMSFKSLRYVIENESTRSKIGDKWVIAALKDACDKMLIDKKQLNQYTSLYETILLKKDENEIEKLKENLPFEINYDLYKIRRFNLAKEEKEQLEQNAKKIKDLNIGYVRVPWSIKTKWKVQKIKKSFKSKYKKILADIKSVGQVGRKMLEDNEEIDLESIFNNNKIGYESDYEWTSEPRVDNSKRIKVNDITSENDSVIEDEVKKDKFGNPIEEVPVSKEGEKLKEEIENILKSLENNEVNSDNVHNKEDYER